jgi:hypothetical protein
VIEMITKPLTPVTPEMAVGFVVAIAFFAYFNDYIVRLASR